MAQRPANRVPRAAARIVAVMTAAASREIVVPCSWSLKIRSSMESPFGIVPLHTFRGNLLLSIPASQGDNSGLTPNNRDVHSIGGDAVDLQIKITWPRLHFMRFPGHHLQTTVVVLEIQPRLDAVIAEIGN